MAVAQSNADGPAILEYIKACKRVPSAERIQFHRRVVRADWSSAKACWSLTVLDGETVSWAWCTVVSSCVRAITATRKDIRLASQRWKAGRDVLHPQQWPQAYDYRNKRVVIIGSGATAVTLVPAMAENAAHVTMLQRSPSYVVAWPAEDRLANISKASYLSVGLRNRPLKISAFSRFCMPHLPKAGRQSTPCSWARKRLPKGYDMETHLTPSYFPWDERVCLAPDGLFSAISSGQASIVTDEIEEMTRDGMTPVSGRALQADTIITATGLNLNVLGIQVTVDGEVIDFSQCFTYKGLGYSGIPNLCSVFGYVNAS